MDENTIRKIVAEVIREIKSKDNTLLIIPEINKRIANGMIAFKNIQDNKPFDLYTPVKFPEFIVNIFKNHKFFLDKQYMDVGSIDLDQYSEIYLIDLQPALLKEVIEIRPGSPASKLLIDGLVNGCKIQILSGFYWTENKSPFIQSFEADINQLKTWQVMLPCQSHGYIYLDEQLITASKLVGLENMDVMIGQKAILTSLAKEYARKSKIKIII